ncbi:MAG: DUF3343 domain-containing protein [Clostridia bacterium]|nr:DUF3343 domain-containing protein [Clostridia bacterium]
MHTDIILIGSITYALKARNALAEAGIRARVRKLEQTNRRGCSYGLELPPDVLLTVASVLRPLNIDYEMYKS